MDLVINEHYYLKISNVSLLANHCFFFFLVKLYNCFFGRSDCSLCLAANVEYDCAWCDNKCAYKPTCNNSPASECPAPVITDVRFQNISFFCL